MNQSMSVLDGSVSDVLGVDEAVVRLDGVDELSEVIGSVFGGPFPGIAHSVLDPCEGPFDGVEIGWQEPEPHASARPADRSSLAASEVVEDDDVAQPRHGDEDLFDPGL